MLNGYTHSHVRSKELLAVLLRQRDGVWDLGATRLLAQVAVSDRGVASRVIVCIIVRSCNYEGSCSLITYRRQGGNPQSWRPSLRWLG